MCCERSSCHKRERTKERINSTVEFYQTLLYPSSYSLQRILIIHEYFLFVKVLIRCCDQVPIRILSKHEWIIRLEYNSSVILLCSIRILSNHEQTYEFLILISSHYQISVRILSNHEQVLRCNLIVCLILMILYGVLSNNEWIQQNLLTNFKVLHRKLIIQRMLIYSNVPLFGFLRYVYLNDFIVPETVF